MLMFEYLGMPLTHQKIVPGNTATALSHYCYHYERFKLLFTDGDTEIVVGDWLVGASSGAVAKVVSVHPDTSTWTNNTGYLILDSWNGTAFTSTEELMVGAGATMANASGIQTYWPDDYPYKGMMAKAALICVYAQTALVDISGGTPNQTQLSGIPMAAASSMLLKDIGAIRSFKCIDYTASSASTVQITFFF